MSAPPPADAQAVYSKLWNGLARAFRAAAIVVAVLAGLASVSAALEGGWHFPIAGALFIAFVVLVRRFFDTEPVYASRAGVHLLRDKSWRTVPWPRVGKAEPVLGLPGPVVVLLLPVEGEARPVRLLAFPSHREALERLRPVPAVPAGV